MTDAPPLPPPEQDKPTRNLFIRAMTAPFGTQARLGVWSDIVKALSIGSFGAAGASLFSLGANPHVNSDYGFALFFTLWGVIMAVSAAMLRKENPT